MSELERYFNSLLIKAQRMQSLAEYKYKQERTEESRIQLNEIKKVHDGLLDITKDVINKSALDGEFLAYADKILNAPTLH